MRPSLLRLSISLIALAVIAGASLLAAPSEAQAAAVPRTVTVQVVPALANVHFTLDGQSGTTDATGAYTLNDSNLNGAGQTLAIPEQTIGSDLRVKLDRVANNPNHSAFSRLLVAELDEDRPVSIVLLTPARTVLPISEVASVSLTDSLGGTVLIGPSQLKAPIWLPTSRPARVGALVAGRLVTYSVKSVMIRGTNVVNSGQIRFLANRSLTWNVPVILYSLTVEGNDLLAGKPAGTSVVLTYPNQTTLTVPLGVGHKVTLTNLPRGNYNVKVKGGVVALSSTVRLSRDQTAAEIIITGGDVLELLALVSAALAVVIAAGVIGRRRRHRMGRDGGAGHAAVV